MTDYVKATNFAAKDSLPSGDANKKVRGTEINDELTAIQTAVATKLDKASPSMTGTPIAPSPSLAADNTQIVTTEWVRDLINAYEPLGTIKAWAGSVGSLPTGWALCNGSNGTLNLTDRFIAGFGGGVFGQNGTAGHTPGNGVTPVTAAAAANGAHSHGGATALHVLSEAQLPAHSHGDTVIANVGGPVYLNTSVAAIQVNPQTVSTGGNQGHAHSLSADGLHTHTVTGSATVPGFFALAFIQKIALL
jgi:microcystin-dependent protein